MMPKASGRNATLITTNTVQQMAEILPTVITDRLPSRRRANRVLVVEPSAIALPVGPTWWLFWVGTGIVVIGGIFALSVRILDDWY